MPSPHAKGNKLEKQAVSELEEAGLLVLRTTPSRFGAKDFFNLWDIIAFGDKAVFFIQVGSERRHNKDWQDRADDFMKGFANASYLAIGSEWIWKGKDKEFKKYPIYENVCV